MKAKLRRLNDHDWRWAVEMVKDWVTGEGKHSHHYAAALKANWVAGVRTSAYWEIVRAKVRADAFDE